MNTQEIQLHVVVKTEEMEELAEEVNHARDFMNLARANIAKNQSCEPADVALVYLATSLDYVIRFFAHLTVDRS